MSDAQHWGRGSLSLQGMNGLTVPVGEKVNYFTPAAGTTVLEISPGPSSLIVVEVEAGEFRCRAGKLDARVFTANADSDLLNISGHPYLNGDGPLRVSNSGGALPTGLVADTDYWIRDVDGDNFRVSLTPGGSRVDITGAGSGTNSIGGDNGAANDVGFTPIAPVASAAAVLAFGAKKLRTDELQVFDTPVTIVGETGAGDILAWWTR